ncbi:MAG: pilin [Candidatus Paceibacterota bacterium]|jgi:glucan phosphoethanolaminetransferase (alkaline phosphatase superfamily)
MKKQYFILPIVLVGIMLVPFLASADVVTETIDNITTWIVGISIGLATLMYVVAGFLWMADAGNAERVKMAKSIITSTTIGLVVILVAKGIISIIKGFVD